MSRAWRNHPDSAGVADYQCGTCEQHWEFAEEAIDCCTRDWHDRSADVHIHQLPYTERLALALRCSQLDTIAFWDAVSDIHNDMAEAAL